MIQQRMFPGIQTMPEAQSKKAGMPESMFAFKGRRSFNDILAASKETLYNRKDSQYKPASGSANNFRQSGALRSRNTEAAQHFEAARQSAKPEQSEAVSQSDKAEQAGAARQSGKAEQAEADSQSGKTEETDATRQSGKAEQTDNAEKLQTSGAAAMENINDSVNTEQQLLNQLAGILGLQPQILNTAMQSAGVNQQSEAPETVDEVVDKLAQVLMLEPEEKALLKQLMQEMSDQLKIAMSAENQETTDLQKFVKAKASDIKPDETVISGNDQTGYLGQIKEAAERLGSTIECFVQSFRQDNDQVDLPAQNLTETVDGEKIINTDTQLSDSGQNTPQNNGSGEGQHENLNNMFGKNSILTSDEDIDSNTTSELDQNIGLTADPSLNLPDASFGKSLSGLNSTKAAADVHVSSSEIIRQVVDKAQIILTGDKSEMVMNLEPESLGKIALKVVTERGIVTAKFIAESQQVKEILESNMQLLKDSLEKQGMSVQSFSVSVGQDGRRGFESAWERHFPVRTGNHSSSRTAAPAQVEIYSAEAGNRSSHYWNESSINLTA